MQLEVNQSNSVIRNRFATDYWTMTEVDERRLQRQNAMPANTDATTSEAKTTNLQQIRGMRHETACSVPRGEHVSLDSGRYDESLDQR